MVYRKRKSSRKSKKPPTWRRYAGKALMSGGKAALKTLKKKLGLNTENKNWDVTSTYTLTGACTSFLSPLNGLAQGTTNNTRTGNGLRMTHMKIRGSIYTNAASGLGQQIRVIGVYQPTLTTAGTVVTSAQLVQTTTNIDTPYNSDLEGIRVIYDKTFTITPQYAAQVAVHRFKVKWSPSYDMGHAQWLDSDTTGLTANMVKGFVRFFAFDDQSANHGSISYYCRTYFVDN